MVSRSSTPISYRSRQRSGLTGRATTLGANTVYTPSSISRAKALGSTSPAVSALGTGLAASTDTTNKTTTPLEKYLSQPDSVVMDEGLQAGAMIGNAPKGVTAETTARDALVSQVSTPTITDIASNVTGLLGKTAPAVASSILSDKALSTAVSQAPVASLAKIAAVLGVPLATLQTMNTILGTPINAARAKEALAPYSEENLSTYSTLTENDPNAVTNLGNVHAEAVNAQASKNPSSVFGYDISTNPIAARAKEALAPYSEEDQATYAELQEQNKYDEMAKINATKAELSANRGQTLTSQVVGMLGKGVTGVASKISGLISGLFGDNTQDSTALSGFGIPGASGLAASIGSIGKGGFGDSQGLSDTGFGDMGLSDVADALGFGSDIGGSIPGASDIADSIAGMSPGGTGSGSSGGNVGPGDASLGGGPPGW